MELSGFDPSRAQDSLVPGDQWGGKFPVPLGSHMQDTSLAGSLVWRSGSLTGKGWRGSLDFVQGKGEFSDTHVGADPCQELSWLPNKDMILTAQMSLEVETLWGKP